MSGNGQCLAFMRKRLIWKYCIDFLCALTLIRSTLCNDTVETMLATQGVIMLCHCITNEYLDHGLVEGNFFYDWNCLHFFNILLFLQ